MTLASFDRVTHRFGDLTAVDEVTLDVPEGQILGLLGPNGAGKSTLLSLIQGLRRPTSGTVRLFGGDPRDPASRVRLGSTPQETALPETLRVGEVLDFVGAHFPERVDAAELAEQFGFADLLKRQTGGLSGGQRRRISVALAFVGAPRLVLLDEPSTGLDVDARRVLWDAIRARHAQGTTIVVTSHYLEEIEALAERVVVVDHGRIVADDALRGVLGRVARSRVTLRTRDAGGVVALADDAPVAEEDGELSLMVGDSDDFVRRLVGSGLDFSELSVRGATLEEAFLALTGEHAEPAQEGSIR
ncbi:MULTISPECIES: ABC transporter ATP-binding protein [unclassified Microbacterium]|uniref:ABC transporter ATP-binding protein n=1 Tax=unclassified Microbacterium TaxID=2609290 RepID=UPI0012FA0663|nr:ABC transporter ATP-binding protein [Microbacterium sp. MAH-37]MVQ41166.1 ATP-binding cassette domain-containing protein [Microbacterium sp. MAH-37]